MLLQPMDQFLLVDVFEYTPLEDFLHTSFFLAFYTWRIHMHKNKPWKEE